MRGCVKSASPHASNEKTTLYTFKIVQHTDPEDHNEQSLSFLLEDENTDRGKWSNFTVPIQLYAAQHRL